MNYIGPFRSSFYSLENRIRFKPIRIDDAWACLNKSDLNLQVQQNVHMLIYFLFDHAQYCLGLLMQA